MLDTNFGEFNTGELRFTEQELTDPGWLYLMHVPMLEAVKVGRTKRDPWLRRQELTKLTGFRHVVVFAKWLPDATDGRPP